MFVYNKNNNMNFIMNVDKLERNLQHTTIFRTKRKLNIPN